MAKFDSIQDNLALGVGLDLLEAAVGVKGRANMETWFRVEIPRLPSSRLLHELGCNNQLDQMESC
jgi:hypothetical protein